MKLRHGPDERRVRSNEQWRAQRDHRTPSIVESQPTKLTVNAKLAICAAVAAAVTACSTGGGNAADSTHVQSKGDVDTTVSNRVVEDTAIVKTDTTIRTDTNVTKDTVQRQGSRPARTRDTTARDTTGRTP